MELLRLLPALVAINRVRALKHFPTDTIIGGIIGASFGLLIPALHKKWQRKLLIGGIYDTDVKGIAFQVRF